MQTFVIRRSFLLPLALLLVLALLLFVTVVLQGQPTAKAVVLGLLLVPITGLFVESFFRRVEIADDHVTVYKPFRQRRLDYADIVSADTIRVKKRAFLTLSSEEHFIILSNAYANFPGLVNGLLGRLPERAITEETAQMAEAPPVKSSDIVSCWFGVILLALILFLQFV